MEKQKLCSTESSEWAIKNLKNELRLLIDLKQNEWFTEILSARSTANALYLTMKFVDGGDLHCTLQRERFSEDTIRFIIAEIVYAINLLHKHGIIHRDLKPANILIDRKGHIKLEDFGMAVRCGPGEVKFSFAGTPIYVSNGCI